MKPNKLIASLLFTVITSLPALALPRSFVSGFGNDANPGTVPSPKRSFASALTVTDPGGEIIVLDSAGYGPVTINKSVSITSPTGIHAGVTVTSGDGITISAGASDKVTLRGLTIVSPGTAGVGIHGLTGGALHVENCVVTGFNATGGVGIFWESTGSLFVSDTILKNHYVALAANKGVIKAERVELLDCTNIGLNIFSGAIVAIRDSTAARNGSYGMQAQLGSGTELSIESCSIFKNGTGIRSGDSTVVRVSGSAVTNNTSLGLWNAGGTLKSRGNNTVDGNGTNVSGTITPLSGT